MTYSLGSGIAVIGLGYVGLPLAVEFGKRRPVIGGFDIQAARIAGLRAGHDHTCEVTGEELVTCTSRPIRTSWRRPASSSSRFQRRSMRTNDRISPRC